MAEKVEKFYNPSGIKFAMEKNSITMSFAYSESQKSGKYIEKEDIQKELSISFKPETFIFTIAAMLKIVEAYREEYDANLGRETGAAATGTEELTNAT